MATNPYFSITAPSANNSTTAYTVPQYKGREIEFTINIEYIWSEQDIERFENCGGYIP